MKRRRWDAILDRLNTDERIVGVEVGVWTGKNAVRLLTARPQLTLYLVDPWKAAEPGSSFAESGAEMAGFGQEEFDMAKEKTLAIAEHYGKRVKVLEMDSADGAAEIAKRRVKINFIFIDGDHSYEGVTRDLNNWAGFLENDSLHWIAGHDYANKNGEVKRAVDDFFGEGRVQVDSDHTWFVFP
jgi:hypothetical protein